MTRILRLIIALILWIPLNAKDIPEGLVTSYKSLARWDKLENRNLKPQEWQPYFEWARTFQKLQIKDQRALLVTMWNDGVSDSDSEVEYTAKIYILLRVVFHVSENANP